MKLKHVQLFHFILDCIFIAAHTSASDRVTGRGTHLVRYSGQEIGVRSTCAEVTDERLCFA